MRIGTIDLGPRPLLLAPMEDVSDPPFRLICKRYGADLVYTEFISAGGLAYGAEGSVQKLEFYPEERPVGIQIFGGDLDQVRDAARIADAQGPDLVDINRFTNGVWDKRSGTSEFKAASIRVDKLDAPVPEAGQ